MKQRLQLVSSAAALDPVTQKRLRVLINVAYFAMLVSAFMAFFIYGFPMVAPFVFAFLRAALLHRPVRFLYEKTPLTRSVSSTVLVLLILGALGFLLFLLGNAVAARVRGFYESIAPRLQDLPAFLTEIKAWVLSLTELLPAGVRGQAEENVSKVFDDLIRNGFSKLSLTGMNINWSNLLLKGGGMLKNTVVQIPTVLIGVIVGVIACVFITIDYDHIKGFVLRQFSVSNQKRLREARNLAVKTLSGMFKAYGLIMLLTTIEMCIGLYILKFAKIFVSDYIVIIAVLTAVVDIIPVLGTGTVLIPWAVYSFISGDIGMGIGLLVMYVVILVVRQIMEPKLVAGQAGLSPIVTIIAMYVGTKTIGILGFFILPFCVILLNKFNEAGIIRLFKTAKSAPASDPPASDPAPDFSPAPAPAEERGT